MDSKMDKATTTKDDTKVSDELTIAELQTVSGGLEHETLHAATTSIFGAVSGVQQDFPQMFQQIFQQCMQGNC